MLNSIGYTIRRLFVSFRDSVSALFDSRITADDLRGLIWISMVGIVVVVFLSVLRAIDNRRPMR
jgi:hypothetical protein